MARRERLRKPITSLLRSLGSYPRPAMASGSFCHKPLRLKPPGAGTRPHKTVWVVLATLACLIVDRARLLIGFYKFQQVFVAKAGRSRCFPSNLEPHRHHTRRFPCSSWLFPGQRPISYASPLAVDHVDVSGLLISCSGIGNGLPGDDSTVLPFAIIGGPAPDCSTSARSFVFMHAATCTQNGYTTPSMDYVPSMP